MDLLTNIPSRARRSVAKPELSSTNVNHQVLSRHTFEDMLGVTCHCHIVRPSAEVQAGEILEEGAEWISGRKLVRHTDGESARPHRRFSISCD